MVRVSVACPVPPVLVAEMATAKAPAVVGVPIISPVAVLMLNSAGKPVAA
jgi:hypothetical protein